jgi:hypothetical protein
MNKNLSKSVWVKAIELKFCMNMLCKLQHETTYSDLDYFEIHLKDLLKISEVYLKNGQKNDGRTIRT